MIRYVLVSHTTIDTPAHYVPVYSVLFFPCIVHDHRNNCQTGNAIRRRQFINTLYILPTAAWRPIYIERGKGPTVTFSPTTQAHLKPWFLGGLASASGSAGIRGVQSYSVASMKMHADFCFFLPIPPADCSCTPTHVHRKELVSRYLGSRYCTVLYLTCLLILVLVDT